MVKKMVKYSKFVLCIALILSLVAPSYAALSASDGSAFVTKAEFDSALADFNARLTTFEAGINSKIDSQVTSYLDRNGIWSGKNQVIVDGNMKSGKKGLFVDWFEGLGYDNQSIYYLSSSGSAGNDSQRVIHINWHEKVDNHLVVNGLNKSGLCVLTYDACAWANGCNNIETSGNSYAYPAAFWQFAYKNEVVSDSYYVGEVGPVDFMTLYGSVVNYYDTGWQGNAIVGLSGANHTFQLMEGFETYVGSSVAARRLSGSVTLLNGFGDSLKLKNTGSNAMDYYGCYMPSFLSPVRNVLYFFVEKDENLWIQFFQRFAGRLIDEGKAAWILGSQGYHKRMQFVYPCSIVVY